MPPVRLMGHLLPSRLPDKRGTIPTASAVPIPTAARRFSLDSLRAKNTDIVGEGSSDPSRRQLSVTRSGRGRGGSLTVRDHDDDLSRTGVNQPGDTWVSHTRGVTSVAQKVSDGLQRFDVVTDDLNHHHHRHGQQHAPDAPDPAPEQQADEHSHLIHGRRAAHQRWRKE